MLLEHLKILLMVYTFQARLIGSSIFLNNMNSTENKLFSSSSILGAFSLSHTNVRKRYLENNQSPDFDVLTLFSAPVNMKNMFLKHLLSMSFCILVYCHVYGVSVTNNNGF
jgi:hypothetical protein